MGIIFPLSWSGRIVLILIAVALGLIFWGMMKPDLFKRIFRKGDSSALLKGNDEAKMKR